MLRNVPQGQERRRSVWNDMSAENSLGMFQWQGARERSNELSCSIKGAEFTDHTATELLKNTYSRWRKVTTCVSFEHNIAFYVLWTQNICEPYLRHCKTGKED
jgi:uncharacterized protein involved in tolerance to divalent cations